MGEQKSLPKNSSPIKLSLVLSFYKDDNRVIRTIREINSFLNDTHISYELIIILNGGYLKTTINLLKIKHYPNTKIIAYRSHKPYGFSVKYGMLNAKGLYIGFVDNSLSNDQLDETMNAIVQQIVLRNKDVLTITQNGSNKIADFCLSLLQNIFLGFGLEKPVQIATIFNKHILYDALTRSALEETHWETELLAIAKSLNKLKLSEQSMKFHGKTNKLSLSPLLRILKNIYFNGYYQNQTINKFNEITVKYAQLEISEKITPSQ
ncbi:hypothetical protein JW962_01930 [Candidatus Dojkabacteria bacterium]|nr:hypothetical protein [Candidatus Dojkabacteria bacterium]